MRRRRKREDVAENCLKIDTYLFLLFVEVINDDTNEQVQGKERSKNDEEDKVKVHVDIYFLYWLLPQL